MIHCIIRAHDYDTNGELDGLELVQAVMHEMEPFVVKDDLIESDNLSALDIQHRVDVITNDRVNGIMGMFDRREINFYPNLPPRINTFCQIILPYESMVECESSRHLQCWSKETQL